MDVSIISSIISIIISLLGITTIVVFHEFGHFVFCKIFNVYAPTFSIGMGKVLFSKKIGDTEFCLSSTPIGGYVEIATDKGIPGTKGFNEIPYYQKILIMLGGIACNFLMTYLIFVGLLATGTMPESGLTEVNTSKVSAIAKESINANNLQPNDEIIAIANTAIQGEADLRENLQKHAVKNEKPIPASIKRNNQHTNITLNIKPGQAHVSKLLDVTFEKKAAPAISTALYTGYELTKKCTLLIANSLKQIFTREGGKNLAGPIMIVNISSKSAQKGLAAFLFLMAIISVNLGFMNLLPLPIFDGGQFVTFTIEAITRRRLSDRVQHIIGMVSWGMILGLLIIFSIKDLVNLIWS